MGLEEARRKNKEHEEDVAEYKEWVKFFKSKGYSQTEAENRAYKKVKMSQISRGLHKFAVGANAAFSNYANNNMNQPQGKRRGANLARDLWASML